MTVSDGGLSDDSSVHSSDGAPSRASSPPAPPADDGVASVTTILEEVEKCGNQEAVGLLWQFITGKTGTNTGDFDLKDSVFRNRVGDSSKVEDKVLNNLVIVYLPIFDALDANEMNSAESYWNDCEKIVQKLHRALVRKGLYEGRCILFSTFLRVIYDRDMAKLLAGDFNGDKKSESASDMLYVPFIQSLFKTDDDRILDLTDEAVEFISKKGVSLIQPQAGHDAPAAIRLFFNKHFAKDDSLQFCVLKDVLSLLVRLMDGEKKFVIPIQSSDGSLKDVMVHMTVLRAVQRLLHFKSPSVMDIRGSTTCASAERMAGNHVDEALAPLSMQRGIPQKCYVCCHAKHLLTAPVKNCFKKAVVVREQICFNCTASNPNSSRYSVLNLKQRVAKPMRKTNVSRKRKPAGPPEGGTASGAASGAASGSASASPTRHNHEDPDGYEEEDTQSDSEDEKVKVINISSGEDSDVGSQSSTGTLG